MSKLCVSLGRGRHKRMMAEHRYLAEEQGVQLVELRVDCIRREVDVKRLLKDRACPCVFTCRREDDGGQWHGNEAARQTLLRTAIVEGVDYVDLEEDIAKDIPRFGKTQRIVSYHNFRETPSDIDLIHDRMTEMDPDIIKLACMAHHPHDVVRMFRLMQASEKPMIGICMGEIGIPTRILAGKFGAPFTFAAFEKDVQLAPGQIGYQDMRDIYRYEQINADTEVYGVIADPVGHSMSPVVHNAAFHKLGMNKVYLPFRVLQDHLAAFMQGARELGLQGLSVTIPHKEDILQFASDISPAVKGIGAANTLAFGEEKLAAHNTDYRAFIDSLMGAVRGEEDAGEQLKGERALVLGSGGVSKAVAYALKSRGADVFIAGRTFDHTKKLAERLKCKAAQWYERYKIEPDILVNGTPVGMHPNVDETPFEAVYLKPKMVIFDTVYNPERTLLVKEAREVGCRVVTGVDMFIGQAALQFEHFTGQKAPVDLMRTELKRTIGPVKF